jgi:hypothetical protein
MRIPLMLAHGQFLISTLALLFLFGGAGIACLLVAYTSAARKTELGRRRAFWLTIAGLACFVLAVSSLAIEQTLHLP